MTENDSPSSNLRAHGNKRFDSNLNLRSPECPDHDWNAVNRALWGRSNPLSGDGLARPPGFAASESDRTPRSRFRDHGYDAGAFQQPGRDLRLQHAGALGR